MNSLARIESGKSAIPDTESLELDASFLQFADVLFRIKMQDIQLAEALLEFPIMLETLPVWTAVIGVGMLAAHELGHALVTSLKVFADLFIDPKAHDTSFYHANYKVSCSRRNISGDISLKSSSL